MLKEMITDGHEVSIVTAHNNRTAGMKFEWVTTHFPFLSRDDIIIITPARINYLPFGAGVI